MGIRPPLPPTCEQAEDRGRHGGRGITRARSRNTQRQPVRRPGTAEALRLNAAAFIVTVYGDIVVPRGGMLWTGTLIDLCARVGISEGGGEL